MHVRSQAGGRSADERLIQVRAALSRRVQTQRKARGLTQAALAEAMKSTQARVAKIEAASDEVSLELMLRAMFALGASVKEVGAALSRGS